MGQDKVPSDEAGCNVGLILGVPGQVGDQYDNLAAIDVDLDGGQEENRNEILQAFVKAWSSRNILPGPW